MTNQTLSCGGCRRQTCRECEAAWINRKVEGRAFRFEPGRVVRERLRFSTDTDEMFTEGR